MGIIALQAWSANKATKVIMVIMLRLMLLDMVSRMRKP